MHIQVIRNHKLCFIGNEEECGLETVVIQAGQYHADEMSVVQRKGSSDGENLEKTR